MNMLSALPIILTILQLGAIVASLWAGGRLLRTLEAFLPSGRTRTRLSRAFIRLIVWIGTSMLFLLPFLDLLGLVRDWVEISVSRPVIIPQIDTFLFSLILLAVVYGSVLWITRKNLPDIPEIHPVERLLLVLSVASLVYRSISMTVSQFYFLQYLPFVQQRDYGTAGFVTAVFIGLLIYTAILFGLNYVIFSRTTDSENY